MESHLQEWLNLLLRWTHLIAGTAWIGASFYFNFLENRLNRTPPQPPGITGTIWTIHGGGIYHLKKYQHTPPTLPTTLHWFKWEAYTTWLTGTLLLALIYYLNPHLYLLPPTSSLAPTHAITLSLTSILASWLIYDLLCRSPLARHPTLLAATIFIYLTAITYLLSTLLTGRAAYIHTGVIIGTIMTANVLLIIIPAQKSLLNTPNHPPTPNPATNALLRSRHNNYLTLPILFIMLSMHHPTLYTHPYNWLILALIALTGCLIRHYFNTRHRTHKTLLLLIPTLILLTTTIYLTTTNTTTTNTPISTTPIPSSITTIIRTRCLPCHSPTPTIAGFIAPPAGLILNTPTAIHLNADRIYTTTVATQTMPLGNLTAITPDERHQLATWYHHRHQPPPSSP